MKTIELQRVLRTERSNRGVLYDAHAGVVLGVTLELPWRDNERGVSCIPEGSYLVDPNDVSTRFGNNWAYVQDVVGRSRIGIHSGNWTRHSRGCILTGTFFMHDDEEGEGVGASRQALNALLEYAGGEEFMLVVRHPCSTSPQ